MKRIALAALWFVGTACKGSGTGASLPLSSKSSPARSSETPAELAAIERKLKPGLRGVVVASGGVFFDGRKLELARLGEALRAASSAGGRLAVIVLPDARAPAASGAIRAAAKAGWSRVVIVTPGAGDALETVCEPQLWVKHEESHSERVMLSILLTPRDTWFGLSRINEFEQVPSRAGGQDYEKIAVTLKNYKTSAFFADRDDLELAAHPAVSARRFLRVLGIACKVGFTSVATPAPEQLAARPKLN
jgi:hypothetical protein